MKNKNRKLTRDYKSKHGILTNTSFRFNFLFLVFCLLTSVARAEVSPELLNPANLIVPSSVQTLQDANEPNVIAKASQDTNIPNAPVKTLQDVNTPNFNMQPDIIQSVRQEQPQIGPVLTGAVAVYPVTEFEKKLLQDVLTIAPITDSHFGNQLWKARLVVPDRKKDDRSKIELQRMIEQVCSVKFEPAGSSAEPAVAVVPAAITEPNEALSDANMPEQVEEKQFESENSKPLPYQSLANRTLQVIKSLSQHPEQADNPLELAEVLFRSGYIKEAAVFYQEALNRKDDRQSVSTQDRAWILFQIGNCVRNDDLPRAVKMYRQLISEYPDSPWTDLAKTQEKLISWYQKDEPKKLVKSHAK